MSFRSLAQCRASVELNTLWLTLAWTLFIGLAAVLAMAAWLAYSAVVGPDTSAPAAVALLPQFAGATVPEPTERFVFLSASMLTAGLAFALAAFSLQPRAEGKKRPSVWLSLALYAVLAVLVWIGMSRFDFGPSLFHGERSLERGAGWRLPSLWVAALAWLAAGLLVPRHFPRSVPAVASWGRLATAVFAAAMILQITSWRLPDENAVALTLIWSIHWDAVAYAVAQVANGRTLLVDLPSQYGLYPQLLGSLFRLTPFSVQKLSLVFASMQVLSLSAVLYVVLRLTRYAVFRSAFGIALVLATFETVMKINGVADFYFQYWPSRFFWPAVSVLAFYFYARQPRLSRLVPLSLCAAIGLVWNADTGVMIAGAVAACLGAKSILRWCHPQTRQRTPRWHEAQALCLHVGIVLAVLAATALSFLWAAHEAPHWSWLFKYQSLFYEVGLNMLPLPLTLATPWMSVLAVYVLGLLFALSQWRAGRGDFVADLIFYLSLLGWGLFIYYQGRSHILNLVTVCWPALAIATILADRTARMVRAGGLGAVHLVLPALALAVLCFCAMPFILNVPALGRDALQALNNRSHVASELVADELAFIRQHTHPGEDCVILAQRQGLYHALARVGSPIRGPGYVETLTIEDRDDMLRQVEAGRFACVFLGTGPQTALALDTDIGAALRGYTLVDRNPFNSIAFLSARQPEAETRPTKNGE